MLNFEIITPEKLLVQEEVDMVEATGELGEFGVLPGHIKFLTTIGIGEVRYIKAGKTKHIATSGGFGEVTEDKVTFLVETAEFAEEIDLERAKRAKEHAESTLKDIPTDNADDLIIYELALQRALLRISTASKRL
ncbi:MAG: F0F1 ATP synthase subunit epsilon [Proteobacteria bacterium]|nr:F0F1 ATP synthase subunit epsilon [Pseudomonadota bacterium]